MTPGIDSVKALPDYKILIEYQNSEKRIFDMSPLLGKGIFKDLEKDAFFSSVRISFDTVAWPNGADIDPETLYTKSIAVS